MDKNNIISRKDAKAKGLVHYFTGKPCPKGHTSSRFVSNCACIECSKITFSETSQTEHFKKKQAEWYVKNKEDRVIKQKKWYEENKDRLSVEAKAKRLENLEHIKSKSREYYYKHREERLAKCKEYVKANRDKVLERNRIYNIKNADKVKARRKEYYERTKVAHFAYTKLRACLKMDRVPSWADKDKIKEIYREARYLTDTTGEQHHVDHIIPLQGKNVCGLHVENNLRVVTAKENLSKNNKLIPELLES